VRTTVDVEWIARRFQVSPELFWLDFRRGEVAGVVDRGAGEDAGRTRLTFHYRGRRCSLVVRTAPP